MSSKYEFIDAEKALYPIVRMCGWLTVSTSGFYEWRGRSTSATEARRDELKVLVRWCFEASDATYGHRRVHAGRPGVDPVSAHLMRKPCAVGKGKAASDPMSTRPSTGRRRGRPMHTKARATDQSEAEPGSPRAEHACRPWQTPRPTWSSRDSSPDPDTGTTDPAEQVSGPEMKLRRLTLAGWP